MKRAFSLVELSIVLVIIGLIAGGIAAGQSLVRNAQLRSVIVDYDRFTNAADTFRTRYQSAPGDMADATMVWGKDASLCNAQSGNAAATGTCNGNGDGVIATGTGPSATSEAFQAWKQLQLAGLIEGTFTGATGTATTPWNGTDATPGVNVPDSRIDNAGWSVFTYYSAPGAANTFQGNYGNMLSFGTRVSGNYTVLAALTPKEAWTIDTKIDDGFPGQGKVMVRDSTGFNTTNSCTLATSSADFTAPYHLDSRVSACALWFPNAF